MTEKMFKVGKIVNTHGIRGDVKVVRITDFAERFELGNTLYVVKEGEQPIQLTIDRHRVHKGFDIIHFSGYDNINDIESFKGSFLKIAEEQLTNLAEGEYYYHEIIGCTVYDVQGDKIGNVTEILSPGANDVWVVKRAQGKDVLIPYIDDIIVEIDIEQKKIVIDPLEGLLD